MRGRTLVNKTIQNFTPHGIFTINVEVLTQIPVQCLSEITTDDKVSVTWVPEITTDDKIPVKCLPEIITDDKVPVTCVPDITTDEKFIRF